MFERVITDRNTQNSGLKGESYRIPQPTGMTVRPVTKVRALAEPRQLFPWYKRTAAGHRVSAGCRVIGTARVERPRLATRGVLHYHRISNKICYALTRTTKVYVKSIKFSTLWLR